MTAALEDEENRLSPRFRALRGFLIFCIATTAAACACWLFLLHDGSAALHAEIEQARRRGEFVDAAELIRPPLPPDQNALHYLALAQEAFNDVDSGDQTVYGSPTHLRVLQALHKSVVANARTLAYIRRACQCSTARWRFHPGISRPGFSQPGYSELINSLPRTHQLCELCREAAVEAAWRGDDSTAVAHLREILKMSRFIRQEPLLVHYLISCGFDAMAADATRDCAQAFVSRDSTTTSAPARVAELYALVRELLDDNDRVRDIRRVICGEAAALLGPPMPRVVMRGTEFVDQDGWPEHVVDFLSRPCTRVYQVWVLRSLHANAQAFLAPDWAVAQRLLKSAPTPQRLGDKLPLLQLLSARRRFSVGRTVIQIDRASLAVRHLAATILAIRLYERDHAGSLPPNLNALVPTYLPCVPSDPFASPSAPVRFVPGTPDPFVYSVSVNGRDDVASGFAPKAKDDDSLISPDFVLFLSRPAR